MGTKNLDACSPPLDRGVGDGRYIDVLSEAECARVREVVYELRHTWSRGVVGPRGAGLGFAAYKIRHFRIKAIGRALYSRAARRLNPVLRDRLGWLYDRLAEQLAEALGAPTAYPAHLALPGFHLFTAPIWDKTIHFDRPYEFLDWKAAGSADLEHPLSFTLAVTLPPSGAGLNLWDVGLEECAGWSRQEREELRRTRKQTYVPYVLGKAVLHSGHTLHQVASSPAFAAGDERITLQGHGTLCDGIWQLYW